MKILLYNDTYKHLGGAETYCLELLDKLKELGHDPYWLSHGLEEPIDKSHIVLPIFNEGKINYFASKYFFNWGAYIAFKKQLEKLKPDVIHIHHNRYYTFSLQKAIKDTKIPVVQTIHDYTLLCPSQYYPDLYYDTPGTKSRKENCQLICSQGSCLPLKSRMGHPLAHDRKRKKIQQNIPTFIAPSTTLKSYLEKAGFQNVRYVPFFINENKWSFDAKRKEKNKVLFVGRVETNKGVHLLMDTIIQLKEEINDIQLVIAGEGSQREILSQRVDRENLNDFIEITGYIKYSEIEKYYNEANVLVVPSLDMEQFGLIGIEALASGTSVVGSNTGGIPEWCIHEETGLLFSPEKPLELKTQIKRMLKEEGLMDELTQNGMNHIKKIFNEKQHFDKLLKIYQEAKIIE